MKMKKLGFILWSAVLATACSQTPKTTTEEPVDDQSEELTSSTLLNKKINLAQEGIRVQPVATAGINGEGYIIFSPDSSQVELLLPDSVDVILDRRENGNGRPVWNVEDDDTYLVEHEGGSWKISRRMNLLFISNSTEKAE